MVVKMLVDYVSVCYKSVVISKGTELFMNFIILFLFRDLVVDNRAQWASHGFFLLC